MSRKQDIKLLEKEKQDLKFYWNRAYEYINKDLANIWLDKVKKDFEKETTIAKRIIKVLEKIKKEYKLDEQTYLIEISDLNELIRVLSKPEASHPYVIEMHADLSKVISNIEKNQKQLPEAKKRPGKLKRVAMYFLMAASLFGKDKLPAQTPSVQNSQTTSKQQVINGFTYQYYGVTPTDYNTKKYKKYFESLPTPLKKYLNQKGLVIVFFKGSISYYPDLVNKFGRYYSNLFKNDDHFFIKQFNMIFCETNWLAEEIIHEIGHAVDYNMQNLLDKSQRMFREGKRYDGISDSKEMYKIIKEIKKKKKQILRSSFGLSDRFDYIMSTNEETFAQLFYYYYSPNPKERQDLKKILPSFVEFLESFLNRI